MNLSKCKQFFSGHKKLSFYVVFTSIIFFLCGDLAFADDSVVEFYRGVSALITLVVFVITMIAAFLTSIISLFLSPDWVNGSIFGGNEHFRAIWILVSNVVYFIFAFILIGIAFMNIVGAQGEKYQLKQALPKFVVGVLIVPFTWFFVQFVLSISALLTVSVLTLPLDTFESYGTTLNKVYIPKNCVIRSSVKADEVIGKNKEGKEAIDQNKLRGIIEQFGCGEYPEEGAILGEDSDWIAVDTFLKSGENVLGILSVYSYGIMGIDSMSNLTSKEIGSATSFVNLLGHSIFDALFVIIYGILLITLAIALLVRGMAIWVFTMVSPVLGLVYFFEKSGGGSEGVFKKMNVKEFISLALVPVYVSAALSFGLLFIVTSAHGLSKDTNNDKGFVKICTGTGIDDLKVNKCLGANTTIREESVGNNEPWTYVEIAGIGTTFRGSTSDSVKKAGRIFGEATDSSVGMFGRLLIQIFGLVILWVSVIAALKQSDITGHIIAPIETFGSSVGKLVASSPQYLPVFGGQSAASLERIGGTVGQYYKGQASDKAREALAGTPFGDAATTSTGLKDIRSGLALKTINTAAEKVDAVRKMGALAKGDSKKLYQDPEFKETLFALAQSILKQGDLESVARNPSDITGPDQVVTLLKKMDATGNYENIYGGTTDKFTNVSHLEEWIKSLNGNSKKVDDIDGTSTTKTSGGATVNETNNIVLNTDLIQDDGVDVFVNDIRSQGVNKKMTKEEFTEKLTAELSDEASRTKVLEQLGDNFLKKDNT